MKYLLALHQLQPWLFNPSEKLDEYFARQACQFYNCNRGKTDRALDVKYFLTTKKPPDNSPSSYATYIDATIFIKGLNGS